MGLRIRDKATDISHKSIVLGVSVHGDYIVKTLILNAPKTQERYMLAYVPSLAIAEEYEVRRARFPYATTSIVGGCVVGESREARVLYCPACRDAERHWTGKSAHEAEPSSHARMSGGVTGSANPTRATETPERP